MAINENVTPGLPFPPVVVGIAGCSGSGKTTLAREIARTLEGIHFHLDDYYLDLGHMPYSERVKQNFDDPGLIESELLVQHVGALARGKAIERPIYDFTTHTRVVGKTTYVEPGRFLVVEGLFALYYPDLVPIYQMRVYIDTPDDLCFERRMKRDTLERGRSPESVKAQYDNTVRPSSEKFVRPSSANAEISVDGRDALDWKVERVLGEMRKRGLLRLHG